MSDYPRWLYSKDHGSIVVDTPEDVVNLPAVDWWTTSTFDGEPYISAEPTASMLAPVDLDALREKTKGYEVHSAEDIQGVIEVLDYGNESVEPYVFVAPDEETAQLMRAEGAENVIVQSELPRLDKRTKAYKDSQKAPL